MTQYRRELIGLTIGLVLGAIVSWFGIMPWVEASVRVQSELPTSPIIAPCDVRLDPLRERIDTLKSEFAALAPQWNDAQQKLRTLEGNGMKWGDDVPNSFREESTKTLLSSAIKDSGERASLLTLDCTEFPCVAIIEAKRTSDLERFYAALTERGFAHIETLGRSARRQTGNRFHLMLLAYWPEEMLNKRQRERVGYRMDELMTPILTSGVE